MADHHREGMPFAAEEDRHEHEDIRQMHAAVIGIVHDDDVAVVKIALEFRQHRRHGFRYRAEMLGDGLGLRHHLAVAGAKRRGEIHDVLDDLGARDPDHGVGHVVGDRIQPALDDRKGDRIYFHASNSRTMQPIASLCALASGGTTMVASNSSMISGPWRDEAPSALRSTISTATRHLRPSQRIPAACQIGTTPPARRSSCCRSRGDCRAGHARRPAPSSIPSGWSRDSRRS